MRRPAPLPERLGPAFTVSAALEAGVSRDRLRATDLRHPFTGARVTVTPASVRDRALALEPLLRSDQHFSHLTAAELLGMRMPEGRRAAGLHLTYREAHRAMRRPDVVGHKSGARISLRELEGGLRVSSPIEAWCECASLMKIDDVVVMGDGLVCRREPIAEFDQLVRAVKARPGRRGTARLRAALTLIRPGTDSARETMLRLLVTRAGFPEPKVNFPLRDRHGTVIAHGDLVWPGYGVVLEYEGRQHADDPEQFALDIRRLDDIAELDLRVIRVDKTLMSNRPELIRKITKALTDRGWGPDAGPEGSQEGALARVQHLMATPRPGGVVVRR